ncbi:hypothetical protein SAMN03080617_03210 [Algoriphagus alkaliphilus]|uniref:Uncharacterized protein n=1 Tax=Algoriphagus alkaliphilus TaxID=279824 RepID=A0A1G5Z5A7_9BACT|nr:hypothetical protein SAMN03080617_03210 [Algoriphagus alkaliphilus]
MTLSRIGCPILFLVSYVLDLFSNIVSFVFWLQFLPIGLILALNFRL